MRPIAPCLGCTTRHGGCWTGCEKYLKFKAEVEAFNSKVKQQKERESLLAEYRISTHCRKSGEKVKER